MMYERGQSAFKINVLHILARIFPEIKCGSRKRFAKELKSLLQKILETLNGIKIKQCIREGLLTLMPCLFTGPKMFWLVQIFCAIQKDDLQSLKLVFVTAQKFLKRH